VKALSAKSLEFVTVDGGSMSHPFLLPHKRVKGENMVNPMILKILVFVVLASSFLSPPSRAQMSTCPEQISVRQQLAEAVAGWETAIDDTPHRLASITFYDGPPEEKASLVNDARTRGAEIETATWHFVPGDRQIWIACGYSGTTITLNQALPPNIRTCSITYRTKQSIAGFPVIQKTTCE
jgi:hypothetical protein